MWDNKSSTVEARHHSKAAGRDLLDNSTNYEMEATKHASAIGNILLGISHFITEVQYEKPDTADYTIEDKIDHNNLTKYKTFFDDYMDNYSTVKDKINIMSETDLTFEKRLIKHVQNKYIKHHKKGIYPDILTQRIIDDIEIELKNHSTLSLEDISSLHYIVFYVFAQCKIFEKPPRK